MIQINYYLMIFLYSIVTFFSWAISTVKSSKLCIIIHNFKVYWFHYNSSYKNRPYVSIDLWHEKLHLLELIGLFFFVLNGQQMKWPPVLMDDDFKRKCVHVPIWHVLSSPVDTMSIVYISMYICILIHIWERKKSFEGSCPSSKSII